MWRSSASADGVGRNLAGAPHRGTQRPPSQRVPGPQLAPRHFVTSGPHESMTQGAPGKRQTPQLELQNIVPAPQLANVSTLAHAACPWRSSQTSSGPHATHVKPVVQPSSRHVALPLLVLEEASRVVLASCEGGAPASVAPRVSTLAVCPPHPTAMRRSKPRDLMAAPHTRHVPSRNSAWLRDDRLRVTSGCHLLRRGVAIDAPALVQFHH